MANIPTLGLERLHTQMGEWQMTFMAVRTSLRSVASARLDAAAGRSAALVIAGLLQGILPAGAQTPALHDRVDQLIVESNSGIAAPRVSDAEFLRRASLDLLGMPPSVEELRKFLADQDPAKRQAAVDRLLAHPWYPRHMAEVFDIVFMERRPAQYVGADEWHQYLLQAFRENRPYNQLAREILAADGADPNPRAAVRFYADRQADPNLLTRDVGRIFFGRDLQCAQCHDHPIVDDYLQADYHGLLAFFNSGALFTAPAPDGKTYYAEKAGATVTFESVFFAGEKHTTGAKLIGQPEIEEPALYPDEQYVVKPADGVRPAPKFSRRAKLAELATNGSNRHFNENIANRLWAHMMGRGLVEPVDFHHAYNPPSNPALLKMLGEEFAAGGFDVRAFLRELALTQTYQRSISAPGDPATFVAQAESLSGQLEGRVQELTSTATQAEEQYAKAQAECLAARQAAAPIATELDQAAAAGAEAAAKLDEAQQQLAAVEAQVAAKTAVSQVLTDAVAKTQEVAKSLPEDQELVQAAQKFAERQQQIAAEVGTLAEDAKVKAAAVQAPADAMTAARQSIDAVRTKFTPLADLIRQKQQAAEALRQLSMDWRAALNRVEEQYQSMQEVVALKPLREQIAAAELQISAAEGRLAEVRTTAQVQQAAIAASEQVRLAAEQKTNEAAAAVAAANQEQERWAVLVAAVDEAIAKTAAAQQLLPDDPTLVQASTALAAKRAELMTAGEAPKQEMAEAGAVEQTAQQQLAEATVASQAATTQMAECQRKVSEAEQLLEAAKAKRTKHAGEIGEALAAADAEMTKSFAMLPLKPLTPEQLCWSIFQVTGVYERYVAEERALMDTEAPLAEEEKQDAAKVAARDLALEQRVYDKLKANVGVFVSVYAPAAGQPQSDFFATANQALFTANAGSINSWVAPAGGNVTERVIQQPDPKVAAEDLYLSVLGRMPEEAEIADVTQYLAARPEEKAACVQELVWGLLTSVEFRFNH